MHHVATILERRRENHRVSACTLTHARLMANRVYYSKFYLVCYVLMILVNVSLILWMSVHSQTSKDGGASGQSYLVRQIAHSTHTHTVAVPDRAEFLALEAVVTVALVLERVLSTLAISKLTWYVILDFLVAVMCLGALMHDYFGSDETSADLFVRGETFSHEQATFAFLILRYVVSFLRLWSLARKRPFNNRSLTLSMSDATPIDFGASGQFDEEANEYELPETPRLDRRAYAPVRPIQDD